MRAKAKSSSTPYPIWVQGEYITEPPIRPSDGAVRPTGNLDSKTELEVMNLLKKCVTEFHQTLVMITHDETIAQMADTVVVIEDGKVVRKS